MIPIQNKGAKIQKVCDTKKVSARNFQRLGVHLPEIIVYFSKSVTFSKY